MGAGIMSDMREQTKITVQIPSDLLARARESSGKGITATVRQGLRLVAAREAYRKLRELKGKIRFSVAVVVQRSLVACFGLGAWPVTETNGDKLRLEEAAEGRTRGIVTEQSAGGTQSHE